MTKKEEQTLSNKEICKKNDMFFCPYCGSENIRFIGFVMKKCVIFEYRKDYFRCNDCYKKIDK